MRNTFGINIIPPNETERLSALKRYRIIDSTPEPAFDRIVHLTAQMFNVPIALISLVEEEQVFFKANFGMGKTTHVDRGISLCSLAVLSDEVTVFENPLAEPCLLSNPQVTGKFGLRFYAGAPLRTPEGLNIGTVCIVDKKPRYFNTDQRQMLEDVAAIVMDLIEGRLARQVLQEVTGIKELARGLER